MGKRYFTIIVTSGALIELDDKVIDVVDDDWRAHLYDLHTPEEIAEMVGYNMIVNRARLSMLDGWADQPDENAEFVAYPEHEVQAIVELSLEDANKLAIEVGVPPIIKEAP